MQNLNKQKLLNYYDILLSLTNSIKNDKNITKKDNLIIVRNINSIKKTIERATNIYPF